MDNLKQIDFSGSNISTIEDDILKSNVKTINITPGKLCLDKYTSKNI